MKRIIRLFLATALLAGCQGDGAFTSIEPDMMSAAISDGNQPGGNPDFFFVHPLVADGAVFDGEFNPDFLTAVEIRELTDLGAPTCVDSDPLVRRFEPEDIVVSTERERYTAYWDTGLDGALDAGKTYRICVTAGGVTLGFIDADPVLTAGEVPDPQPEDRFVFLIGSEVLVNYRIQSGALCLDFPLSSCGEGTIDLAVGGTVQAGTGDAVQVPAQGEGGVIAVVVRPCAEGVGVEADIPLFGACYEILTFPELEEPLTFPATVSLCSDLGFPLSEEQEDALVLHRQTVVDGEDVVYALPNTSDICFDEIGQGGWGGFLQLAWRSVRSHVVDFLSPEPLYAGNSMRRLDRGRGGLTSGFSAFQIGLPSKMEILEGDGQEGEAGAPVAIPPAVLVTDVNDDAVAGASVTFAVTMGDGTVIPTAPVVTGADGVARVDSWTLGLTGVQKLEASGFGIADPVVNGPLPIFDPFTPAPMADPDDEEPVMLARGTLEFTALSCPSSPTPDGVFSVGEWDAAQSYSFSANVSRGSARATLYVTHDCENLHVAVQIERSEMDRVNNLRIDFDNDGDGITEAGDDVWFYDADDGFMDLFLTEKCTNSSQSNCGDPDTDDGGTMDGSGAFGNDGMYSTYEMSHPLNSGDAGHDVALEVGDEFGLFLTLSIGQGAQGNTQWPGFRVYLPLIVQ